MTGYKVTIKETSKELTAKEKVRIKDFSNAIQLDSAITGDEHLFVDYAYHVDMVVHNDKAKSEKKDYTKRVILDKDGQSYLTGSEAFCTAMDSVLEEMADAGEEDFKLDCYKVDSKNFSGKQFLTCTVI